MDSQIPRMITVRAAAVLAAALMVSVATESRAAGPDKIDCKGGEATITGDHRIVEVSNCSVVRVEGNHDNVSGVLTRKSKVFVTGDDNKVDLRPPEGSSFGRLKDTGHRNVVSGHG